MQTSQDQTPLLEVSGVRKSYGGVLALRETDLAIRAGEVHALIGENGAGKSTLVKVLTGVHSPDAGTIRFRGEQVGLSSPDYAERLGIHAIHQHLALVSGMSILDNFLLGSSDTAEQTSRVGVLRRARARRLVTDALDRVGLEVDPQTRVRDLSVPQAQLVQIARAFSASVSVLVLDEPTASLTAADRDNLFERLRNLRGAGVGLVYVSHRLDEITTLCDRATVLRDGAVVDRIGRGDLTVDRMIASMLDRPMANLYPDRADIVEVARRNDALEVRDLVVGDAPPVSFAVKPGEVVGLTGLLGAGMVEVAEAIAGIRAFENGTVASAGRETKSGVLADAVSAGISLVPESRADALVSGMSVANNLALTDKKRLATGPLTWVRRISRSSVASSATETMSRFDIQPPRPHVPVGSLSGGNQQKVVIAKALSLDPRVLVLIDPTAGVDVGSRAQIYSILRRLAEDGLAVLLVSSDGQEVSGMSDRTFIFRKGSIVHELGGGASEAEIMKFAVSRVVGASR